MAANEPEEDWRTPEDARLTSLNERLNRVQLEEAARQAGIDNKRSQQLVRSVGMRILSVLIGYPLGGGLIGWTLDMWFDTLPWFTLGMMFLGFGLAVREVLRTANKGPGKGPGD
ncbi:MAG TPA: AtpZ/AtpI family protein [Sphingomicrobium sp.]|nr:AtpZ/AtpI family protein [Sphingomicrobium sp.]